MHPPRTSPGRAHDTYASDGLRVHTGQMIVRTEDEVILPDDLVDMANRLDVLEARPLPVGRSYMVAQLGPVSIAPGRVMSSLTGWRLGTDGGLRGITIVDAGFIIDGGSLYVLVLSDVVFTQSGAGGIAYNLQRQAGVATGFERPVQPAAQSTLQWMFPFISEIAGQDTLVINCANTNSQQGHTLQVMRAVWLEMTR